jgi:hypothetical protein
MGVRGSRQRLTELGFQPLLAIGADVPAARLNAAQVAGIGRLSRDGAFNQRQLADRFAARQSPVSPIVNNQIRLDQLGDSMRQASKA